MNGEMILVLIMIVGVLGKSPVITIAASILLILKLTALDRFFTSIERRGLELGLLFLTIAVLVPFATEKISLEEILSLFMSIGGILALAGGLIATYMNKQGLYLLQNEPQMIIGLIVGSIIGIVLFKGIPVGPLMAASLAAILVKARQFLSGG